MNKKAIVDKIFTINNLSFHCTFVGNPHNPVLVFLHGHPMPHKPADTFDFTNVLLEFAKHYYVIAPEHIGTMRSDPSPKPITIDERTTILHKLLIKLGIKNATISAQSFGGGIASSFALKYPSKVKRLILIDSSTTYQLRKHIWLFRLLYEIYNIAISLPFPITLKRNLIYFSTFRNRLSLVEIKNFLNQIHPKAYITTDIDYSKINAHTLLVWGNRDQLTPLKYAHRLNTEIKNSKLILVDGGHTILYQKPEYVIDKIISALVNDDL